MTQPINSPSEPGFSPARLTFGIALMSAASAVAAGLFTTISPLGGAIFGASFGASCFLGHRLIHWICDKIGCCPDSIIFRVGKQGLSVIGGIAAGMLMTNAIGFSITMTGGVALIAASIGVAIAALLALGGCLCSSFVTTGVAVLGSNEIRDSRVYPQVT